jgi:hypothetical protein
MMALLRAVYLEQMMELPKVVSREIERAVRWEQKRELSMVGPMELSLADHSAQTMEIAKAGNSAITMVLPTVVLMASRLVDHWEKTTEPYWAACWAKKTEFQTVLSKAS